MISPLKLFLGFLVRSGLANHLDDEKYLRLLYRVHFHRALDLSHPTTFNEKLQWLKLNNRNSLYTKMVDKLSAKEYVGGIIGMQYIIPTYGYWSSPEEIEWDMLPNSFVLKCTHNSGMVYICKDKSEIDKQAICRSLYGALKENYYYRGREWPYKDVKPLILAEELLTNSDPEIPLRDYKYMCFNGEAKYMYVGSKGINNKDTRFDFFDMEYNHLDCSHGRDSSDVIPPRPKSFFLMKGLAEKLSAGLPFLRVDFYETDGGVFFGELTFFPSSGMRPFSPDTWDEVFGGLVRLPID